MSTGVSDRIIVGVDGSDQSDAAIRWAATEAVMHNAPLTLLYVAPPGVAVWGMGYAMAPLPYDYGKIEEEEGKRILEAARVTASAAVSTDTPIRVDTDFVFGSPMSTLIDATKDAKMIVVGSRGHGAWQRAALGSMSSALVHHAHCPVTVIHDPTEGERQRTGPVVVGVDGSPASELATSIAFDEASRRGADLVAIHAWLDRKTLAVPVESWPDFQPRAEETLAERLAGWAEKYPDVAVERRVFFDQAAKHLVEAAESAQLTVVGSHGRGGFAGMLLGSVSTAIVHAVRTPVIVARRS